MSHADTSETPRENDQRRSVYVAWRNVGISYNALRFGAMPLTVASSREYGFEDAVIRITDLWRLLKPDGASVVITSLNAEWLIKPVE